MELPRAAESFGEPEITINRTTQNPNSRYFHPREVTIDREKQSTAGLEATQLLGISFLMTQVPQAWGASGWTPPSKNMDSRSHLELACHDGPSHFCFVCPTK